MLVAAARCNTLNTTRALVAVCAILGACSSGPEDAPFGFDARPANPTCKPPPRLTTSNTAAGVALAQVWKDIAFSSPVALLQAPGEPERFYVVEQGGKVRAMKAGGSTAVDVLSYPAADITTGGETGLLGLAFSPDWTTSRTAYVSRTAPGGSTGLRSVVTRIKSTDGGVTLDRATEQELLVIEQPFSNHNGGNVAFGPDGYLYLGFGDGGSGGDPMGNGQSLSTLLGKLLRIDVASAGAYQVPADNPFVGRAGARGEIWAFGLRNPWRWSFDRATGALWVGDVGQNMWEEIDVVERGGNYGWNVREGKHCYNAGTCASAGMIDPVWDYSHADGVSVTGGYVYRGAAIPPLVGTYVFSDYGSGKLWGLFPSGASGALAAQELLTAGFNVSSFGEGIDGELYMLDLGGRVFKIVPSATPGAIGFPGKLSETGCVDRADATTAAPGLVPYEVNVPFWSDGAEKRRWLALPDGGKGTVGADGDIDLPIGTVLMKEFRFADRRVETRLFMRHDDGGWAGYTYEWDDDGKDATLVLGGKKKALSGQQSWLFPSGAECLSCHNEAAGGSLGLEVRQLARDVVYEATNRRAPQLATLAHLGMLDAVPVPPTPLPITSGPDAVAPIDQRARTYLHVNCGFCHRPNGPGRGTQDLRIDRTFAQTLLCGAKPTEGDLGVTGATLLQPGAPDRSILSLRLHATDDKRMPPLANLVHDDDNLEVIDAWIRTVAACP